MPPSPTTWPWPFRSFRRPPGTGGGVRSELTYPLPAWLRGCDEPDEIVRVCRDVLDRTALPALWRLADSNNRARTGGGYETGIWLDERHRDALRAGIRAMEQSTT